MGAGSTLVAALPGMSQPFNKLQHHLVHGLGVGRLGGGFPWQVLPQVSRSSAQSPWDAAFPSPSGAATGPQTLPQD